MTIVIFRSETGSYEEWLQVNDDGTVTHHVESSGWAMRGGLNPRDRHMSANDAKSHWTSYAEDIDKALAEIAAKRAKPSN